MSRTTAGVTCEIGRAEVMATGAGPVNQAAKAVAIARSHLAQEGIPAFAPVDLGDEGMTAIRLTVGPR